MGSIQCCGGGRRVPKRGKIILKANKSDLEEMNNRVEETSDDLTSEPGYNYGEHKSQSKEKNMGQTKESARALLRKSLRRLSSMSTSERLKSYRPSPIHVHGFQHLGPSGVQRLSDNVASPPSPSTRIVDSNMNHTSEPSISVRYCPGELGLRYDTHGVVKFVKPDSQSDKGRVHKGWKVVKINNEPVVSGKQIHKKLLDMKLDSFTISFEPPKQLQTLERVVPATNMFESINSPGIKDDSQQLEVFSQPHTPPSTITGRRNNHSIFIQSDSEGEARSPVVTKEMTSRTYL